MTLGIAGFSHFITEMNDRARDEDAEGLASWAVGDLSRRLGFDAAWYGWANLRPDGVDVYANATLNLPEGFYDYWRTMSHQDLLAQGMIENPGQVASYDRRQARQTDGMTDLSDKFGLRRMVTAMNGQYGDYASFYISSYRMGDRARHLNPEERDFLQCAVDQLSAAMKLTTNLPGDRSPPGSVTILASEVGIGLLGLPALRERFGEVWPRWTGDLLPEQLARLIALPGKHILSDHDLLVTVEATPKFQGLGLRRMTLRRLNRHDLLTTRERQVAQELALGKSAKEVARTLGVAPATVRNQTQAIYQKLQIDNRAALVSVLNEGAAGDIT
jgi:DNA-binding CsgD family transcriptional regulator